VASQFGRLMAKALRGPLARRGFSHVKGACFEQSAGAWTRSIVCSPMRYTPGSFDVLLGIWVPAIDARLTELCEAPGPHFVASVYLGSRRPGASDFQELYGWEDAEAAVRSGELIAEDLSTVGLPWFQRFQRPSDVARHYHVEEIVPRLQQGQTTPIMIEACTLLSKWAKAVELDEGGHS
jgi:hypothetical protein